MIKRPNSPNRASGMSLIEVLVAVLLTSFGLLGLVSLQARSAQFSVGAEDRQRAALLAGELAANMWGARSVSLGATAVAAWAAQVAQPANGGLPNGVGTVVVTGSVARITIQWRAPGVAAGQENTYVTDVLVR